MRHLSKIFIFLVLSSSALGSTSNFDQALSSIETKISSQSWSTLVDWKQLAKLSPDEKFKIAVKLEEDKVIDRKLFFTAKHRPTALATEIRSGKLNKKETELRRLSLSLISDLSLKD